MNDAAPWRTAAEHDPFAGPALTAFYPVTESQREVWLAATLEPRVTLAYNEGLSLRMNGPLDVAVLERALQLLAERHESLRGCFSPDGRWMCVQQSLQLRVPVIDLSTEAEPGATLRQAGEQLMSQAFDLEHGPLLRFALYRTSPDQHCLLFVAHHLICDGWSFAQLLAELAALYSAGVEGRPMQLPDSAPRYGEYCRIEHEFLHSDQGREHAQYWLRQLNQPPPPVELPLDHPRPPQRSFEADRYDHPLPRELSSALRRFGGAQGTSLVMTLLAGFCAQLQRLSGAQDMVVGLAAAGQSLHEQPTLVGHCVNLLPLRLQPAPEQSFADLLKQTRSVVLDAFEHQGVTFGALLPHLGIQRDEARPTLISVVFNIDVRDDDISHSGLEVRYETLVRQYENFELFVNVVDDGRDLAVECSYNRRLFERASIRRRMAEFECLLAAVTLQPQSLLSALPLMSADEKQRLLQQFAGSSAVRTEGSLHARIAQQAHRRPDAVAIEFGSECMSYAQLLNDADAIAAALQTQGVQPGDFVAVCLRRQLRLPAALLGVLKCGAAYVPLDPDLPPQRLKLMFEDAAAKLLLCEHATVNAPGLSVASIMLEQVAPYDGEPIDTPLAPEAPAYAIYTSGSTGAPKGVVAHHRGVLNCLAGTQERIPMGAGDTLLALATYAFDASVLEIFLPLICGARVAIASTEEAGDGTLLANAIERHAVTRIFTAPAAWRLLLAAGWAGKDDLIGISWAEPLTPELATALLPRLEQLWNLYGPTETSVWTLGCRITDAAAPITIGEPIPNTRIYILDAALQPVPVGVPGELYIGGTGVTLGYLNRPELTAERFVDDPFFVSGRMYRSGDLARWTEDARVLCLGRADHQVKLRGFRIELGEIESHLKSHPAIADATCGLRERGPGDPRLVAWVQAHPAAAINAGELRQYLRGLLPGYMVPQHLLMLEALPRLANGKLNRQALADPFARTATSADARIAARNETEQRVAQVWEEVLGHSEFGVVDRFLDVGGHSLLAVQVAARLRDVFGTRLPLREIMNASLAQIASELVPLPTASVAVIANSDVVAISAAATNPAPISERGGMLAPLLRWLNPRRLLTPRQAPGGS